MKYYSTARVDPPVSFRDAVINGQPADGGLYFPATIPRLSEKFLKSLSMMSDTDIAFHIIRPYVGATLTDEELYLICRQSISFPIRLKRLEDDVSALELFHGRTLAFKDVGARFLAGCLSRFAVKERRKWNVIVATSGDTGGAVAAAFSGVANVDVFILFPKGRVSRIQELQLTTNDRNVHAIEIDGTFDDCQALVKAVLTARAIRREVHLTSANSINITRLLSQQFYYFIALKHWTQPAPPVISVPSGNFGNLTAGVLSSESGLKVAKFIAATNANDVVPRYLATRNFSPRASIATLSNAMDVSNPSNFVRVQELFGYELNDMRKRIGGMSVSDEETRNAIRDVWKEHGYLLDPHGAVGYVGLRNYLAEHKNAKGIFLHTAHAAKFDSVKEIIGDEVEAPPRLKELLSRPSRKVTIAPDLKDLREILIVHRF